MWSWISSGDAPEKSSRLIVEYATARKKKKFPSKKKREEKRGRGSKVGKEVHVSSSIKGGARKNWSRGMVGQYEKGSPPYKKEGNHSQIQKKNVNYLCTVRRSIISRFPIKKTRGGPFSYRDDLAYCRIKTGVAREGISGLPRN